MNRFLLAASLGVGVLLLGSNCVEARPRQTSKAKRLSVMDYYFLMPFIGSDHEETAREETRLRRASLRSKYKPVIDLRHDYLSMQPDSAPRVQIAVFRGAADVVAYSSPDFLGDNNIFALYRLKSGKLRDVTKQLLPVPVREDRFLYELPRVGTTIHVFSYDMGKESRKPAFDLRRRGGRFVKENLKRTK